MNTNDRRQDEEDVGMVESPDVTKTSSHASGFKIGTSARHSPSGTNSPSRTSPRNETSRLRHLLPLPGVRKGIGKQEWSREIDFPLAGIALAVDLSNIAHISFLICNFGGIAFFIPYFFFLFVCAFPLLYMEIIIGQSIKEGLVSVWKIVPVLKGIGYSIEAIFITLLLYYLTPATWSVLYLLNCFEEIPPWSRCDNPWNTRFCKDNLNSSRLSQDNLTSTVTTAMALSKNGSDRGGAVTGPFTSPSSEFLRGRVLRIYKSPFSDPTEFASTEQKSFLVGNGTSSYGFNAEFGLGNPLVDLTLCLLVFYILIYIFVVKGIKWIGYSSRVIVPASIVILGFLLVRGMLIDGAWEGVSELMYPKWEFLYDPEVWAMAATQVFFSLGAGLGTHLTLAGHNKFKQNPLRDSWMIIFGNTFTSLVAVVTMCEYIGHNAFIRSLNCSEYIAGLGALDFVFVVIPDSTGTISGGSFGSFLFFTMMILIMLDTTLILMYVMSEGIGDDIRFLFPNPRQATNIIQFFSVAFAFSVNILTLTRGGLWLYEFLDHYAVAMPMCITMIFQTIAFGWIWGLKELGVAAEEVTGHKPGLLLQFCWKYLSPISITAVLIFVAHETAPVQVDGQPMPKGVHMFGTCLKFLSALCIPSYAVYVLIFDRRHEEISFFRNFLLVLWPQDEHQMLVDTKVSNRLTLGHLFYTEKQLCLNLSPKKTGPERQDSPEKVQNSPTEKSPPVFIKYSAASVSATIRSSSVTSADTNDPRQASAKKKQVANEFRHAVEDFNLSVSESETTIESGKRRAKKKKEQGGISRKKNLAVRKDDSASALSITSSASTISTASSASSLSTASSASGTSATSLRSNRSRVSSRNKK